MHRNLFCLISLVSILCIAGSASAASSWDGNGGIDNRWTTAGNWNSGVPGTGVEAVRQFHGYQSYSTGGLDGKYNLR